MKVLSFPSEFFYLPFNLITISSMLYATVIPLPLFVFSPGFTIQIFLRPVEFLVA